MKKNLLALFLLFWFGKPLFAQYVYTINADSVKITNHCDTAELILENHTQTVPGFLFNKGRGRTEFRKVFQKFNDSLYIFGADTLAVQPHPWVQGGNSFGTTGVFGTVDNNHLDFYTHDSLRGRLTNTGHWLLGTTTDNGNTLQVNGKSTFSGDVNIGSATITNTGNLIGTNAFLHDDVVSQFRNFQGRTLYISQLVNVFYNYTTRFNTTSTTEPDGSMVIDIVIPDDELVGGSLGGITYPAGKMYFSFWPGYIPQSITVYMKNRGGTWYGPYNTSTNISLSPPNGFYQVNIPTGPNYLVEYRITITAQPGIPLIFQNLEYMLDGTGEGIVNPHPFVGKYGEEIIYNNFYFKNAGQNNVRISPYMNNPNYYLNNTLMGSTTDNGNAKLQVTGNITATGNMGIGTVSPAAQLHTTGSVRFAGLTNDSTQTRVLVSDAGGNLYYRNLSSWASGGMFNSNLAVRGTLSAQQVKLMPAGWADYVFDKNYHMLTLPELADYIRQNNHLPGIPSAIEVKEKGIEIGENQAALLKKIEELTLYAIGQDKKLQSQDEQLKKQNEELENLKQQMAGLIKLMSK